MERWTGGLMKNRGMGESREGWMNGWMDGWIGEWMDAWMGEWMDG